MHSSTVVQDCLSNSVEDEQKENKSESKNVDHKYSEHFSDEDIELENIEPVAKPITENLIETDDITDACNKVVTNITKRKLILKKSSEMSTNKTTNKKVKRLESTSPQPAKQVDYI